MILIGASILLLDGTSMKGPPAIIGLTTINFDTVHTTATKP